MQNPKLAHKQILLKMRIRIERGNRLPSRKREEKSRRPDEHAYAGPGNQEVNRCPAVAIRSC